MKKCFSMLVAIFMAISLLPRTAFAAEEDVIRSDVLFITETSVLTNVAEKDHWTVLPGKEITKSNTSKYKNIIVDCENFNDENDELRSTLVSQFENGARIIILGDVALQTVQNYFNVESKQDALQIEAPPNSCINNPADEEDGKMVDVSTFDSLGVLLYKSAQGVNVTDIKIEDASDESSIIEGLENCMSYDYFALATSGFEVARAGGYTNTWINVDVTTKTYITARCTINTSIKVDKNAGNPNADNEYLQYTPYIVDIRVHKSGLYGISKVSVEVKGGVGSKICDYGPTNQSCSASGSVSFGLPYSVSVSFSPESKVGITKVAGGIDSNNVRIEYQPKSLVGLNCDEFSAIRCEAHIESYQKSANVLFGSGQYQVHTYEYDTSGEDFARMDYIKYYNSEWNQAFGA